MKTVPLGRGFFSFGAAKGRAETITSSYFLLYSAYKTHNGVHKFLILFII